MKNYFLFFGLLFSLHVKVFPQELKTPESAVFDQETNTLFVSNLGNQNIQQKKGDGSYTLFVDVKATCLGIAIYNHVVYVATNKAGGEDGDNRIYGYDMATREQVFSLRIDHSKELNDLAFDRSGNLYVSDRGGHVVYKVDVRGQTYSVLVAKNVINTPNGLYYDERAKRLLVCNTIENSSIYSVQVKTGQTRLLLTTGYPHLDGLVVDKHGDIYLTSWSADWGTSTLLRYKKGLKGKAAELQVNKKGMADMNYCKGNNSLVIANWYDNSVSYFKLDE